VQGHPRLAYGVRLDGKLGCITSDGQPAQVRDDRVDVPLGRLEQYQRHIDPEPRARGAGAGVGGRGGR